jgi:hypothetical protein
MITFYKSARLMQHLDHATRNAPLLYPSRVLATPKILGFETPVVLNTNDMNQESLTLLRYQKQARDIFPGLVESSMKGAERDARACSSLLTKTRTLITFQRFSNSNQRLLSKRFRDINLRVLRGLPTPTIQPLHLLVLIFRVEPHMLNAAPARS